MHFRNRETHCRYFAAPGMPSRARWRRAICTLLAFIGAGSAPLMACDPGYDTTGPAYCFLSEVGGCDNLPAFLAAHQPIFPVTLVIDEQCSKPFSQTLVLPGRMTLAGVGRDGEGALLFENLALNMPAIAVAPGQGNLQIRDLLIRYVSAVPRGIGLRLNGNHLISMNGVRIDRFNVGVQGTDSYSIVINQSNISDNRTNLILGNQANSWRVRDSILGRALGWSVVVRGPNNDVLFDGNRLESNQLGGFQLFTLGTVLANNRLEFNGQAGAWHGVEVRPGAQETRILSNIFSTDIIDDAGAATRCAFNINVAEPASCL